MTNNNLEDLIAISRHFGADAAYVIAGGGNTSFKDDRNIWVKSSGTSLKDITLEDFAVLHRHLLQEMYDRNYNGDADTREAEVKADLYAACHAGITVRPSVETSLHEIIDYPFVVHTHPTLVNAVTCSNQAAEKITELFGEDVMYVPWCDPGYILFATIRDLLTDWRKKHGHDPQVIFLQNHGVFVSALTVAEIRNIYEHIESTIRLHIRQMPDTLPTPVPTSVTTLLPAIRMLFSDEKMRVCGMRNSMMATEFLKNKESFARVSTPFIPDQIVYCKARAVYLQTAEPANLIEECRQKMTDYLEKYGYPPRIIGIRNFGIVAIEDSGRGVETLLDVFEDWMKICYLSDQFGGPHYLSERDIQFIDNWEVENYRRKMAQSFKQRKVENKIVVVTGGAQGFGAGICESMYSEGANIVVADMNETTGKEFVNILNKNPGKNRALFVKTNVAEAASVENLVYETVTKFGGIDVFISNAGILRAGSLDEMTPETFDLMTRINYNAYFNCAKYASAVMKVQSSYHPDIYTDIIQINSKSGLKGSNKNFAYAGAKFGGIGLTQSFALELIPFRIKVNAICPGNFFEGPLWSDPENGLFVQYLRKGKVPGAKTIEDIKASYEKQVPSGRGCRVSDVMKAIYYVIDQEYETGQAVPVTGGQEMLK